MSQTGIAMIRITRTIAATPSILTGVQSFVIASLKNTVTSRTEPSTPDTPTLGGGGVGGADGHASARDGDSFRNGLSLPVARGHCGLSMYEPSSSGQSPWSQVNAATSSVSFR